MRATVAAFSIALLTTIAIPAHPQAALSADPELDRQLAEDPSRHRRLPGRRGRGARRLPVPPLRHRCSAHGRALGELGANEPADRPQAAVGHPVHPGGRPAGARRRDLRPSPAAGRFTPRRLRRITDEWHVHDMPELIERLTRHQSRLVRHIARRRMEALGMTGEDGRPDLAMLHVWLWSDHPDGMFANYNPALPYLRAGLPTSWAHRGDYAAARGIDLLNEGACDRAAGRTRRFLGADQFPRRQAAGPMRPGGERGDRRPRRRRHRRRTQRGRRTRLARAGLRRSSRRSPRSSSVS